MHYKGFTYEFEEETELDELAVKYHYVVDSAGNKLSLDYTGYSNMTEESFRILVDNNFMDRGDRNVPWNKDTLKSYQESLNRR